MLPTFMIIGAMKAGTTSLAAYVGTHPQVFVCTPKEPNFFSRRWEKRGVELLPWYESLFDDAEDVLCRGEASVSYAMAPTFRDVPARIASVVPDARLVYLIRNPIERIRSMYVNEVGSGDTRLSLRAVIDRDPRYLEISRYADQAERYLEHFAREQLLIASSERLRDDRAKVVSDVLEFIGADGSVELNLDFELKQASTWHRAPKLLEPAISFLRRSRVLARISKPTKRRARRVVGRQIAAEVPADVEDRIWEALTPDLRRLRALVGPDFDLWGHA